MTASNETLKVDASQTLWNQVVADYRQICLLRRQGREAEATRLVNENLPKSIALWTRADSRNPVQKKAVLENLFATEHKFMDSVLASQHELAASLVDRLVPAVCQQVTHQLGEAMASQFQTLREQLTQANEALWQRPQPSLPTDQQHASHQLGEAMASQFQALREQLAQANEALWQRPQSAAPVHQRIRFDDIPGVIDAVIAEQQADYGIRRAFAH